MSKEKNLVYLNEYGVARVSSSRVAGQLANGSWCGPAIDRLHEFEKLGLEPEEIERLREGYEKLKGARQANLVLGEMNNDLHRELKELRSMNQKQYENIAELQKENERLLAENEMFKAKTSVNNLWGMEQEIKRLQHRENIRKDSIRQLNEIIYEKDRNIKGLEATIETLEEKLCQIEKICNMEDSE